MTGAAFAKLSTQKWHVDDRRPTGGRASEELASSPPELMPTASLSSPGFGADAVLALQRTVGNQAVARALTGGALGRVLARADRSGEAEPVAPRQTEHGSGPTPDFTPFDARGASVEQRLGELPGRVRASDGRTVQEIWRSFEDLPAMAREQPQLFADSLRLVPELADAFPAVKDAFKHAVEQKALDHLHANRDYVAAEMDRLGVSAEAGQSSPEQHDAHEEVQHLAGLARDLLKAQHALKRIELGHAADDPEGAEGTSGALVTFSPDRPAEVRAGSREQGYPSWEEVNAQWLVTETALGAVLAHSPALVGLLDKAGERGGEAAADQLARAGEATAAVSIDQAMRDLMARLDKLAGGIGGDYTWKDLELLHDQVLSEPPFTAPLEAAVARQLIAEHRDQRTGLQVAIGAAGLVAAVFTVFGAAAMGTALGALSSAGAALHSVPDLLTKRALQGTRTGHGEHDLVVKQDLDAAAVRALLDVVLAFVDGWQAWKALGVLRAEAALERLGQWATLDATAAHDAVLTAMTGMGEAKALDAIGGLDALRAKCPGSPALRRAEAYASRLEGEIADHLGAGPVRDGPEPRMGEPDAAPVEDTRPPEELLAQARAYVGRRTGLPEDRALDIVHPGFDANQARALRDAGRAVAGAVSQEWLRLGNAQARAEFVHNNAMAWARPRGVKPPRIEFKDLDTPEWGSFNKIEWKVTYNLRFFSAEERTVAAFERTLAQAVHELRHAEQATQIVQYLRAEKGWSLSKIRAETGLADEALEGGEALFAKNKNNFDPQAREWYESQFGRGAADRAKALTALEVYDALAATQKARVKAVRLLTKQRRAGIPDEELTELAATVDELTRRGLELVAKRRHLTMTYEEAVAAYEKLPEEIDAYRVQREYQAMLVHNRVTGADKRPPPLPKDPPPPPPSSGRPGDTMPGGEPPVSERHIVLLDDDEATIPGSLLDDDEITLIDADVPTPR